MGQSWTVEASPVLMRYPNASATEVAFVARGELWTTGRAGGPPTELTHGPGEIVAPHFSPDGRFIAFTREVADSRDIYVMSSVNGPARRLTFDGSDHTGYYISWMDAEERPRRLHFEPPIPPPSGG